MRYPFSPFKIDTRFKENVSYGVHEGLDINGIDGGNTDCDTELFPIFKGETVHTSLSKKDYGNIVVFRITGPWGERFIRYAHCSKLLSKTGENISEDKPIALMGNTGNSTTCHLHFDVMKTVPNNNWRYYTKQASQFPKVFEDPFAFIEKWKDYNDNNMDWLITYLLERGIDPAKEGEARGKLQDVFDGYDKTEQLEKDIEKCSKDVAQTAGELEQTRIWFQKAEEDRDRIEKQEKEKNMIIGKREAEITGLMRQISQLEAQLENNGGTGGGDNTLSRFIKAIFRRG